MMTTSRTGAGHLRTKNDLNSLALKMKRRCLFFLWLWIIVLEATAIEFSIPQGVQHATENDQGSSENDQGAAGNVQGYETTVQSTVAKVNEMFKRIQVLTKTVNDQPNGAQAPRAFTGIWGLPDSSSKSSVDKIHRDVALTANIKIDVQSLFLATAGHTKPGNQVIITKAPGINGKKQNFVQYDPDKLQIWFFDGFYSMTDENARAAMLIKSLMLGHGLQDTFPVQSASASGKQAGQKNQGGSSRTRPVVYGSPAYRQMLNQGPSVTVYCAEAYRAAALAVMKDRKLKLMTPQGPQSAQGGNSSGGRRGRTQGRTQGGPYRAGRRGKGG
ncbi:hypothetical protein CVT24_004800 [Panaeolus cyanescens]|uniref:Uncharacterized protein n=1 Tax=Panaeolus cyanescens TaxID=181874 RepID=A0A409VQ69_9AGAR|nr:hypothetical protein CVT24_004800 [Panaeolus cyanescens]